MLCALSLCANAALSPTALAQDDGAGLPEIPPPPPPRTTAPAAEPDEPTQTEEAAEPAANDAAPATAATAAPAPVAQPAPSPAPTAQPTVSAPPPARTQPSSGVQTRVPEPESRTEQAVFPSPSGESGILRVASADGSKPGLIRVGLGFEFFTLGDFFAQGDENTRFVGILSLSGSPIDYTELWLNVRAASNSNNLTTPGLLQSQGDLQFGIKGFYPVADIVSVGADAQLTLLSGIGETGYDFGASVVDLRLLATADLRKNNIPFRAHLNAGYTVDNSDELLNDGEPLSNVERFALGIGGFDRVVAGAGIEIPVPYVTPYVEYSIAFPVDYLATPGVVVVGNPNRNEQVAGAELASTARPAVQRVIPQRLTPGVRITPVEGLAVDVAVEIGLTPDKVAGVPVVPDYNVFTMLSYTIDPAGGGGGPSEPPIGIPLVMPTAEPEGPKVAGVVLDKATNQPVPDAIVSFEGALPVATAADGRFESGTLEAGLIVMTVRREGYAAGRTEFTLNEGDAPRVEVALEPEMTIGQLAGSVVDATGAALPRASVRAFGPEGKTLDLELDAQGRFTTPLDAGNWRIVAVAEGFLRSGRSVEVVAGESPSGLAVQLPPRSEPAARVEGDRIEVPEPALYAKGETTPSAGARKALDWVADLLLADPSLRIEVGGHTDSRGNESDNQEVSERRAAAARTYLVQHGVPGSQIGAQGYGSSRPVSPNLTRTGREQNRRIDFVVR